MLKELHDIYTIHPWLRYTTWFGLLCLAISLLWLSGDFSNIASFPSKTWLTLTHTLTGMPQAWHKQGAASLLSLLTQMMLLFLWLFAWVLLCWVCLSFIRSSIAKITHTHQKAPVVGTTFMASAPTTVGARLIAPAPATTDTLHHSHTASQSQTRSIASAPTLAPVITTDTVGARLIAPDPTTRASQRPTTDLHERETWQGQPPSTPTIQPTLSTRPTQPSPSPQRRQPPPQQGQTPNRRSAPTRHIIRASQLLPLEWQQQQDEQASHQKLPEQRSNGQELTVSTARVPQGYIAVQDIPTYPGNRQARHTDTHLFHPLHSYAGITAPTKPRSSLHFDVGVSWDVGLTRKRSPNEDSLAILQGICTYQTRLVPFGLFIVADGMGGHAFGQEASRLATQSMMQAVVNKITKSENMQDDLLIELLIEGVGLANQHICIRGEERSREMGTTVTAALVVEHRAYIVNVGDSRTYLYREGEGLSQITHDHSLVAHLVANGLITPDAVYTHPERNKVYRSVGNPDGVEVDWFTVDLYEEDHLLLCSDGLWEMVRDHDIERILHNQYDSTTMSNELLAAALHGGGTDNISVIVVRMI